MDLRSSIRLLRERWMMVMLVTALAAAASGVLTWRETPQYASQVTMFVSARAAPDDPASAYHGGLLSQQKVKSYAELLREWYLMSRVVDRLNLELTPDELAGKVTTATVADTTLLVATVHDPSPLTAQQLAKAIGEEFVAVVPEVEGTGAGQQPAIRATVVSPALRPVQPVSPRPVRNVAAGTAAGLLLGLGLAVVRRNLDTTIKTTEQAAQAGDVPSLGFVPFDASSGKRPLVTPAAHGPRVEAYRKVAANLQFVDVDDTHKLLMVTSAVPGEGKSITACNLAVVLAEMGKRVLVIDADLRRPSVSRYLGLPNGAGLTTVLLRRAELAAVTQSVGEPAVSILTSGPTPPNPTSLLGSRQLRELLTQLREDYDAVVLDTSPVLPVADTAVLAAVCDGAVMVVRHGKTRQDQLRQAVDGLAAADIPVLGTVLNRMPRARGYGDYRYLPSGADQDPDYQHGPVITSGHPGAPPPAQPATAGDDRNDQPVAARIGRSR